MSEAGTTESHSEDQASLAEGALRVKEVLRIGGIERIIWIDDGHVKATNVLKIANAIREGRLTVDALPAIDELRDVRETTDGTLRPADEAADILEALDRAILAQVDDVMQGLTAAADPPDSATDADEVLSEQFANARMEALFSGDVERLTPEEWRRSGFTSLTADSRPTLVLLDRHLGAAGDTAGDELLSAVIDAELDHVVCAMFTRYANLDTEHAETTALLARLGAERAPVVMIAKRHLAEPDLFAGRLLAAILAKHLYRLVDVMCDALESRLSQVLGGLRQLDVHELFSIMMAANREGAWLPDALLRLARHGLDRRVVEALRDSAVGDLLQALSRAATLNLPVGLPHPAAAWRNCHDENYDTAAYLNSLHLPLETGDVFEVTVDLPRKFVLLEQPCNLMVRSDGVRGYGLKDFGRVAVAEIEVLATDDSQPSNPRFALPHFAPQGSFAYVRLNRVFYWPVLALDLCVFNESGESSLSIEGDAPTRLTPSWIARHGVLRRCVESLVADFATQGHKSNNKTNRSVQRYLCGLDRATGIVECSIDAKRVSYSLKRVARVREPLLTDLVLQAAYYQSRIALPGALYATVPTSVGRLDDHEEADGS